MLIPAFGSAVAVESKFTEWLEPRRPENPATWAPYLSNGAHWAQAGLARCQVLAERVADNGIGFRHLHVAQLLKHALGLLRSGHSGARLLYLYFDWPCAESDLRREDIRRFADALEGELGFEARTYQDMFQAMATAGIADAACLQYLRRRYFSG